MKLSLNKLILIGVLSGLLVVLFFVAKEINFTNKLILKSDFTEYKPYVGINRVKSEPSLVKVTAWLDLPQYYETIKVDSDLIFKSKCKYLIKYGVDNFDWYELSSVVELKHTTHHELVIECSENLNDLEFEMTFEKSRFYILDYFKLWI